MTTPALEHDAALAELTADAEALDEQHLHELATFALRVQAGLPVERPEYDDDAVLPILKACLGLSREDRRRFNTLLATINRKQGIAR